VSIDQGWYHACGVHPDGSVACWGDTDHGGTAIVDDIPDWTFDRVAVGQGGACGLRRNGDLACWGDDPRAYFWQVVPKRDL
jgi:hypothetical protein